MANDPSSDRPANAAPPPVDRRKWQTPKLVEYGHIGKLTQGSSGTKPDSGSFKPCL